MFVGGLGLIAGASSDSPRGVATKLGVGGIVSHSAFDLVVEIITVQALPNPPRRQAITNIGRLVGTDGTLLVISAIHDERRNRPLDLPPWPLRRDEIDAFATDGLTTIHVGKAAMPHPTTAAAGSRVPSL